MIYRLKFEIEPVEQERPRATRYGKGIRLYDPKKVVAFKQNLGYAAKFKFKHEPIAKPIRIEIKFFRALQKSLTKNERARRLSHVHRPIVKPDLDNYIKSTLDALNGIIWVDDNLIVDLNAHKYYSDNPRIELEVEEYDSN
ncbi:RusA family crossover junction endodeoxyribonuclease [Liquorilactobacillus ghanensis]|uniref:RusA family crossover junction endodeoxyribonuclease n=1 Tax=Liquorilactobacillus ghanensis TaxID=399370 RepID=UPI0039EC53A7